MSNKTDNPQTDHIADVGKMVDNPADIDGKPWKNCNRCGLYLYPDSLDGIDDCRHCRSETPFELAPEVNQRIKAFDRAKGKSNEQH